MSDALPPLDQCPQCHGIRTLNWQYRHANDCSIRAAEDATQAADYERLRTGQVVYRDATPAEVALVEASGRVLRDHQVVVRWNAYRYRTIGGHGPEF